MRIGIFGGAFNPPHNGHVEAAKIAAAENGLDLLIIIPTGTSPHKTMPSGTPNPDMRLLMVQNAFFEVLPNIVISDMEVYSNKKNYTIDTISDIQGRYPRAKLYLLVGNDMYDTLDTWKDSKALLRAVTPVLLPRDRINISSTKIRKLLPERKGMEYLTKSNYSLIIKHRLYNSKPDWDWLRSCAHSMLDPQRIPHSNGCEETAIKLARHWGESTDDAREAAILHDITKKLDFEKNICIIAEHGLSITNINNDEEKLLHSLTASLVAKSVFGVSDRVATAIERHTTGSAGMSLLDKIIYVADYIEPTRDFPQVDKLRQAAFEDIDRAMVMGLQMAINDLLSRGIPIDNSTYEAFQDLSETITVQSDPSERGSS